MDSISTAKIQRTGESRASDEALLEPALVAGRGCDSCNVCCVVPKIDEPALQKLPGCRCPNALSNGSCAIYEARPRTCRGFYCGWRLADWIDERLRPDQSGIFIRFTRDENLVSGKYPFAMIVTVLGADKLSPGLAETIRTAVNAGIATYMVVPGPPGHTSCRMPLNRVLLEAARRGDKPVLLAMLAKIHARIQSETGKERLVVLSIFAGKTGSPEAE
jgi:hypothetical protein